MTSFESEAISLGMNFKSKYPLILLCLLNLFFTPISQAYVENPNLFPLGEQEAMMANTGVAITGSTGSVFYNPAGLAGLRDARISMSANSYMLTKTQYKPFDSFDGSDLDFTTSGLQAVPSSIVSAKRGQVWTYAFSVLVPQESRMHEIADFETASYSTQLIQSGEARFILIGVSAAASLEDDLDFGYGCFMGNYTSSGTRSVAAQPHAGSGLTNNAYFTQTESIDVKGILCNAGIQKPVSDKMRIGASLRLPFFRISGTGKYYVFSQDITGAVQNSGIQKVQAQYDIPTDLSVGLTYQISEKLLVLADTSYQFPVSYKPFDGSAVQIQTKATARFNFGAKYKLDETSKILGGFAQNPGAQTLQQVGDLKEDFTIMQLGYEWTQNTAITGVSAFSAQSNGESMIAASRIGKVNTNSFGLIITGGFTY